MVKILLVEDDTTYATYLQQILTPDYDLTWVSTMQEALLCLEKADYSLYLLDVILPDGDGYQIFAEIKNRPALSDASIIFLSSQNDVHAKVTGFNMGAEDFIVKPCDPHELRARIDAKIRKRAHSSELQVGRLKFDFLQQRALLLPASSEAPEPHPQELELTPREFRLLTFLSSHPEQSLSRDEILQNVWGEHLHVSDRSINTHIAALRKKLGDYGQCIRSVHGTGYLFSPAASSLS